MLEARAAENAVEHRSLKTESARNSFEGNQPGDASLFESFQKEGDVDAFERLFARHKDAVFGYLWTLCGNRAVAEDLSQYCWLRLMENTTASGYRPKPGVSIRSFLFTLGRNRYIDEYKRKHVETMSDSMDGQPMAAAGGSALEAASREEMQNIVAEAVEELPFEQREVLAMWLQGFSIEEMVTHAGAPRDTVLSRKKYAMKKLQKRLDAIGPRSTYG
jgi:RNA polymerase sigma-70 factor (ECF subfamily)